MNMDRSETAIVQTAESLELSRLVQDQTRQTITESLKLLRLPVYPADQRPRAEQ